ncbi:hypothetical protein B0T40_13775 [Chromobacterium haemolyticum]|uniref:DegT/DnrJ/EryC1/StrS family aminotransferase n=1 Tax=Chromobacterium haemolyticum TaxID=394935 RepID=UPI0009DAB48D|nr:DegT/DnrJ/EryC1/StrS family aminotransferase [Chromobacterium haemolyticum]OQS35215.1 hypothetical protein B0T40_13775 [Chromobacterium haemolyticum]
MKLARHELLQLNPKKLMGLSKGTLRKPVLTLLEGLIESRNLLDRNPLRSSRPSSSMGGVYGREACQREGGRSNKEVQNVIAARHCNVPVIEGDAQILGATYLGKKSRNALDLGCTSFFPSKPLGRYGDGGAIFTHDDALALALACREIRGRGQSQRYFHARAGVGRSMDALQCSVALAEMECFKWGRAQRPRVGGLYNAFFDLIGARRIQLRSGRTSTSAQCAIQAEGRVQLDWAGIAAAVHYPMPLKQQSACRALWAVGRRARVTASALAQQGVRLSVGGDLTDAIQAKIFCVLTEIS